MKFYGEQMNVTHKVHYQQNVCIYYVMLLHVSAIYLAIFRELQV